MSRMTGRGCDERTRKSLDRVRNQKLVFEEEVQIGKGAVLLIELTTEFIHIYAMRMGSASYGGEWIWLKMKTFEANDTRRFKEWLSGGIRTHEGYMRALPVIQRVVGHSYWRGYQ